MTEDLIAKTIYNEARGEGEKGMDAVASTIVNRQQENKSYYGGQDQSQICSNGYKGSKGIKPNPSNTIDQQAWNQSKNLAQKITNKTFVDTTGGATHFDRSRTSFSNQEKNGNFNQMFQQGNHHFFREGPPKAPTTMPTIFSPQPFQNSFVPKSTGFNFGYPNSGPNFSFGFKY